MNQQFVLATLLLSVLLLATVSSVSSQKGRSFVNANRSPARKVQGTKTAIRRPSQPLSGGRQLAPSRVRPSQPQAAAAAPQPTRPSGPAFAPAAPQPTRPSGPAFAPAAPQPARPSGPSFAPAAPQPARPSGPSFAPAAPRPVRPSSPLPAAPRPTAAIAAPVRESFEEGPHPAPEPYSFSFAVDDKESGAQLSREESQDINGNIVGFYHILDAEGRRRRVDYTAGPEGFKAKISSNEEGLMNRNAADADFNVEEAPLARQNAAAAAAQARAARSSNGRRA